MGGGSEGCGRGEGWQAHSVRGESCNSDSSPEPSAACSEGVGWGERRVCRPCRGGGLLLC
jgi:hypothetical protein